jgi:hypothetical protein
MKISGSQTALATEHLVRVAKSSAHTLALSLCLAVVSSHILAAHTASADDELSTLSLGGPLPTATADISERNIEQRETELKTIEESLLQKINSAPQSAPKTPQSGLTRTELARDNNVGSDSDHRAPTIRTATYTTDSTRRARGSADESDRGEALSPERGPTHSVPVEQTPTKVSAQQRLEIAESQVTILSRELETSRRGLRSAEKRIEELAELVKGRAQSPRAAQNDFTYGNDRESLRNIRASHTVSLGSALDEADQETYLEPTIRSHSSSRASITATKAAVRTGPGKAESMLFLLPAGSQVIIDRRSGEWYRVVTDSGARGWIFGQALLFDDGVPAGSSVRVKAVRSKYEPTQLRY